MHNPNHTSHHTMSTQSTTYKEKRFNGAALYSVRKCRACGKQIVKEENFVYGPNAFEKSRMCADLPELPKFEADETCEGDCCE